MQNDKILQTVLKQRFQITRIAFNVQMYRVYIAIPILNHVNFETGTDVSPIRKKIFHRKCIASSIFPLGNMPIS